MKINIVECPSNSYKLTGKRVDEFQERALRNGNELYLDLYQKTYKKLIFNGFNILWTSDTISTNDIDPKDGFWAMNYFFFNVALIKLLNERGEIKVIDKTEVEFRNQYYFFEFLKSEGIPYQINEKKYRNKTFKNSLKKFVKGLFINVYTNTIKSIQFIKNELLTSSINPEKFLRTKSDKKKVYLLIPPIDDMTMKDYLNWRYYSLFDQLKYPEKKTEWF